MSSKQEFAEYITDQCSMAGPVLYKKMFGEYGLYLDGKMFGVICDNKLFFKPTEKGKDLVVAKLLAQPYPGAKPHFLIEKKLEDNDWLAELINITCQQLPPPRKKK